MSSSYHAHPTAAAASSSHYSRYDDDALDTDEEEEERRLSEQYGEADHDDDNNDNARNKRRGRAQVNTTLTEEDAAAAKEFEEKVRSRAKKARPSLQPAHLKSAKGLLYVRRAFPTLVKKYPASSDATESSSSSWDPIAVRGSSTAKTNNTFLKHKLSTQSQIKNAARYSRSLMSAYHEFAHELFPSLAAEDVFLKIEDLGSKKEVKDYLQLMRDEFRKEYLEGIYGVEKTGRLLNELEHGLKVHQKNHLESEDDNGNYYGDAGGVTSHGSVAPRLGHAIVTNEEDGEDDTIITTSPPVRSSPPTNAMATAIAVNPYSTTSISHTATLKTDFATGNDADKNMANVRDEGEDDDAEATFSVNDDGDAAEEPASERLSVAGEVKTSDEGNAGFGNSTESEVCEVSIDEREVHVDGRLAKDDTAEDEVISPTILGGTIQELINVDNNNVENDRTQETLTLLESQLDNSEMDATQDDDRFSQEGVDVKWNKERKDGIDETFVVGDDLSKMAMEKLAHDEEQNTADERFSQFTQISGLIFEQDEGASQEEEDDENEDKHGNCDQLGQPTQLSMEY